MTTKITNYEDDGRTICNMDVEGMQGYGKTIRRNKNGKHNPGIGDLMTRPEAWYFAWHAILAGLLIVSVFSVTWVLFILFCTEIWFR